MKNCLGYAQRLTQGVPQCPMDIGTSSTRSINSGLILSLSNVSTFAAKHIRRPSVILVYNFFMEEAVMDNSSVARLLRQMAAAHEAKGENRFTIRAYETAADSVDHTPTPIRDLWQEGKLSSVPGFGKSIESHIDEYFRTGKIKHFEQLKKGLPEAMFEILGLPHVRSKTAYKLAKELKLRPGKAVSDLENYAVSGKIRELPGFGEQSEKEILDGIVKSKNRSVSRMLISEAIEVSSPVISYLQALPGVLRADPLGSLRRYVSTIGDIDIAASTNNREATIAHFLKYPNIKEVLWSGDNKATVVLKNGRQVDLMVEPMDSYGSLLQHFTGSKAHNIELREHAIKRGLSLSEHGIKEVKSGKNLKFSDEVTFYSFLGLAWIPPEIREGNGEIMAAQSNTLPQLIELPDIKGDLQSHTIWSDGTNTVAEMAAAAKRLGYQYFGVTDHQLSLETLGVAKIKKEIIKRKKIIEQINYSSTNFRVLNGIELLIKADGNLAYPDKILAEFDYVIASIHTGFNMSKAANTQRITKSLRNPFVKIFGHPTGRLINQRDPIEADWAEIFKVCAEEGKTLEIDGLPDRLDLPDLLVKEAKKAGCKFIIDTDAHSPEHLDFMRYGVSVARRGWLTKNDVVNTLPFGKLKAALNIKRNV